MNTKYMLPLAVLASLAVTTTAQADYKVKVKPYASVRLMLEDNDVKDDITGENALSRFGIKGSQKISQDLSVFGGIEYAVDADDTSSSTSLRLGYAGFKGSWGKLSFGSQTQVWHKFVRGAKFSDGTDSLRLGSIRDRDSLQYYGKAGKVKYGISRSFEGDGGEHTQVGAAIPLGSGKLGIAYMKDENGGLLGLRPEIKLGNTFLSLLYYKADDDFTEHGANLCKDGGDTTSAGIYAKQKLGNGLTLHGRYMDYDCDTKEGDSTKVELIKQLTKKSRLWLAHETGEGGNVKDSETQLGVRFDF